MLPLSLCDQGLLFSILYTPSQTAHCGWGAEAAESIKKGDFIIEYIGEGSFVFFFFLQQHEH